MPAYHSFQAASRFWAPSLARPWGHPPNLPGRGVRRWEPARGGRLHREPSKITWRDFREYFEREHLSTLRQSTREKYESVFNVLEEEINPRKLAAINERTINEFVTRLRKRSGSRSEGLKPVTLKNYLVALKTALRWAKSQKMIHDVPAFPTIKVPKQSPKPIPTESVEKLLDYAFDDRWRTFMLCGWLAGLRLSEAHELRWTESECFPWVDFENDRFVLPAVFAKSGSDQWVPMAAPLRAALEAMPRTEGDDLVFRFTNSRTGERLTRSGVTNNVLHMAKQAGVKLSMHRLRKAFGCRIASKFGRGNAPILHRLMRHSSMQITMDYYANVDDVLHDVVNEMV